MIRSVLITRPMDECAGLQRAFDGRGITLHPFPVFRLEEVDDEQGWWQITGSSDDPPDRLIIASPRAPERFVRQCSARAAEHLLTLPVAVVGDATATAAVSVGLEPTLIGPGTGAGLAAALIERLTSPETLIFACGHHRRPELTEILEAAGHRVLPVVLYRMDPTPAVDLPTLPSHLDAVVLTSPRAAGLYFKAVGRVLPCPHWAMGPTTRDAARNLGIECSIPSKPTLESIAEELCRN